MIDAASLQAFSDKHCRGKVARPDLLLDMCAALGVRLVATVGSEALWHDPACPFKTHCYCDDSAPHDKFLAQGIEAQRAETLGSVHESPVAESDAPKQGQVPPHSDNKERS